MRAGQRQLSRVWFRWRTGAGVATRLSPTSVSGAVLQQYALVRTLQSIEAAQDEAAQLAEDLVLSVHENGEAADNSPAVTKTKRTRSKRRALTGDDATENEVSEIVKRRQAAVVQRDDFWDDDEAIGHVGNVVAQRNPAQENVSRPTRRRRSRSKSNLEGPIRPAPANMALVFSIDALVEATAATSAGIVDGSSNRLHAFASAKGLHQGSVDASVSSLLQRLCALGGEDVVFVAAVLKVCLYFAARGSLVGHARMLLILTKAALLAAPTWAVGIAHLTSSTDTSSGRSFNASIVVATLYEVFVRPALLPVRKGGKAKLVAALLDDCTGAQRELATLLLPCIEQCAASSASIPTATSNGAAPHDALVAALQHLHHRVSFLDVATSIVSKAASHETRLNTAQLVGKGRRAAYEALLVCVKEILMPPSSTTPTDGTTALGTLLDPRGLTACFELAADPLQTWSPSDREHVRLYIARSFVTYCEGILGQGDAGAKDLVVFMDHAVLDTRTMGALRRIAHESMPCYDIIAREILSCATVVMSLTAPKNDAAGRLSFVEHYVQRLVSSGLPLRTLFASQFCIGLTAQELLAIVRLHRSSAPPLDAESYGAMVGPSVPVSQPGQSTNVAMPEILTRTLMSHVSSRIAKLRVLSTELEASAFYALPEVEECTQDCVQLMAEFALLHMHQSCVTVAQHLATLWQLLDKYRRDPLESFLSRAHTLLELRGILEQVAQGTCLPRASVAPIGEAWTLLVSKLCDTVGQLASGAPHLIMNHIRPMSANDDQEQPSDGAVESQRIAKDGLILVLTMTCAVGQVASSTVSQLTKHFAALCAHASHEDFCHVLNKLAAAMEAAVRIFVAGDVTRCQSASRLYQNVLQELLRAHRGFSADATLAQNASWSETWELVTGVVAALKPLCCGSLQMESECAELMVFRTEQLSRVLARHLSKANAVPFSSKELLAVAQVMYLRRTAHFVSDEFDKRFTTALVLLFQRGALSMHEASDAVDALGLSTVMLQKGNEQAIERWLLRFEAALSIPTEDLNTESLVQLLRCIALHGVGNAHRVTPVVRRRLLPLLAERLPDAPLPLTVESLRSLSHLGIGEAPLMAAMVRRILTEVSQLGLGDCGDVAGLVPMLINAGHDAALALPSALAERAIEKRLSADASDVSRLVRGFSALSAPEHATLREKVLNGLILRCMHVAASMAPEELLATLEGYLAIQSSHMSLLGVVLARISDSKDAFPLPLTIRLVSVSLEAARYDSRVSKACVTAAQPVFLALTQHLLKNDVMSLVGTANHAELILNCLSSAFSKEAIADDVIRAVAQHCTHVPPAGILAALRLIALRGSADFNAANILFQHCLSEIVPQSSPLQLAQTTLQLVRCGIRAGTLFVAVDKRLVEVAVNCNATALACLCEAHLLSRRDDGSVLCKVLCDRCIVSTSDGDVNTTSVMAEMTLNDLRLAIVVLVSSTLTIPQDHLSVLRCILERIASERIQLRNQTLDAIDALQVLQQLVKIIPYASSNASSTTAVHTTILRDAAEVLTTAALVSLPLITGHAAQLPDLSKTVDFALCLAKLQLPGHTGMVIALRAVLANGDAVKQRHVLTTKVVAIAGLRPADGLPQDAVELFDELETWLRGISEAIEQPPKGGEGPRVSQASSAMLDDALALE